MNRRFAEAVVARSAEAPSSTAIDPAEVQDLVSLDSTATPISDSTLEYRPSMRVNPTHPGVTALAQGGTRRAAGRAELRATLDGPNTEGASLLRMKGVITGLVAVHLVVTLWHGIAHRQLGITLPPGENLFVYSVIVTAPLIATLLVWLGRRTAGVWLLFVSMLGSLLFGAYHHYLLVSPDNIHHLPAGAASSRAAFVASAHALTLLELTAVIYGAFCLGLVRPRRPR